MLGVVDSVAMEVGAMAWDHLDIMVVVMEAMGKCQNHCFVVINRK